MQEDYITFTQEQSTLCEHLYNTKDSTVNLKTKAREIAIRAAKGLHLPSHMSKKKGNRVHDKKRTIKTSVIKSSLSLRRLYLRSSFAVVSLLAVDPLW
ncbi:hypothetical protein Bca101_060906 [Brassica carinata]